MAFRWEQQASVTSGMWSAMLRLAGKPRGDSSRPSEMAARWDLAADNAGTDAPVSELLADQLGWLGDERAVARIASRGNRLSWLIT